MEVYQRDLKNIEKYKKIQFLLLDVPEGQGK